MLGHQLQAFIETMQCARQCLSESTASTCAEAKRNGCTLVAPTVQQAGTLPCYRGPQLLSSIRHPSWPYAESHKAEDSRGGTEFYCGIKIMSSSCGSTEEVHLQCHAETWLLATCTTSDAGLAACAKLGKQCALAVAGESTQQFTNASMHQAGQHGSAPHAGGGERLQHGVCVLHVAASQLSAAFFARTVLRSDLNRLMHCDGVFPGTVAAIFVHLSGSAFPYFFMAATSFATWPSSQSSESAPRVPAVSAIPFSCSVSG